MPPPGFEPRSSRISASALDRSTTEMPNETIFFFRMSVLVQISRLRPLKENSYGTTRNKTGKTRTTNFAQATQIGQIILGLYVPLLVLSLWERDLVLRCADLEPLELVPVVTASRPRTCVQKNDGRMRNE